MAPVLVYSILSLSSLFLLPPAPLASPFFGFVFPSRLPFGLPSLLFCFPFPPLLFPFPPSFCFLFCFPLSRGFARLFLPLLVCLACASACVCCLFAFCLLLPFVVWLFPVLGPGFVFCFVLCRFCLLSWTTVYFDTQPLTNCYTVGK